MEEYSKYPYRGDNPIKRLKIVVIALAALLAVLLVFFLVVYRENRANMQVISDEKEVLQQELIELAGNYDGLKTSNDSLNAKLSLEQEKITGLLDRMKRFRADSYAEINRYKKEVNTLKTIMRGYIVQIDSLDRSNKKLLAENNEVKRQIGRVRERNKTLEEKTTRMEETLEQAGALSTENVRLYPVNRRGKETVARKGAQLKVDFSITSNVTARRGPRYIYLRVTRPDGRVLAGDDGARFKHDNAELEYTARREIVYEGERLEVSIYWPNDGSLGQGKHVADLFSDGRQIGTGEFILK
ncbi:MAG: hypothetical protein LBF09_00875 [Odoribacteraceae bacterium]|jgi:FtsZ-binding cell division protein ZapB|nr:hypothetical protein [Odoribacteraceae bacterium]